MHWVTKIGQKETGKKASCSGESRFLMWHSDRLVFGLNNMKAWIHPYCINGSDCCWWCNGVRDTFLAYFGHFSANWAPFKLHSLPEYCC